MTRASDPDRMRVRIPGSAFLYSIVQRHRSWVAVGVYGIVTALAYLAAVLLGFDFEVPGVEWTAFGATLGPLVVLRLMTSRLFRLTAARWRWVGTRDVARLVGATVSGSLVFAALTWGIPWLPTISPSILILEWVFSTVGVSTVWILYRVGYERLHRVKEQNGARKRALIVGAGEAGSLLAREILRFHSGYRVVGFVDDDPFKWGTTIHGVRVLGAVTDLTSIAQATRADEIIIAVPSATPAQLRRIVDRCELVEVPFKVLPGVSEVLEGHVSLTQLRPLRIDDLLGREPVSLELPELQEDLEGRTVLITGGAGSIGSELARQVAANRPGRLVLLDQAESDLYYIQRELEEAHPDLDLACVLGDILHGAWLQRVFRSYAPDRVFHAAAYKHVPLVEGNVHEAVRNNVLGTWRVARAAAESGAAKFVLISTDKAVAPVSVMGATKRVAERVVMACHGAYPGTAFCAVRFGNVMGSRGSVVPIFQKQLERRRPLTVTHPEMTRYFMTTSEAVQLVLQASLLEEAQGRIAMLDMGEPIPILELARNMIRLSGLREGADVAIRFIGLRPGERLHERLASPEEHVSPTSVEKVHLVQEPSRNGAERLWTSLEEMEADVSRLEVDELLAVLRRWAGRRADSKSDAVLELDGS